MIDSKIIFWGIADGLCRAGDFGEGEASESVSAYSVFHLGIKRDTRYSSGGTAEMTFSKPS